MISNVPPVPQGQWVMQYGMSEKMGLIAYGNEGDEVFIGRDLAHTRSYSEEVPRRSIRRSMISSTAAMRRQRRSFSSIWTCSTNARSFFLRRKKCRETNLRHFLHHN